MNDELFNDVSKIEFNKLTKEQVLSFAKSCYKEGSCDTIELIIKSLKELKSSIEGNHE